MVLNCDGQKKLQRWCWWRYQQRYYHANNNWSSENLLQRMTSELIFVDSMNNVFKYFNWLVCSLDGKAFKNISNQIIFTNKTVYYIYY